MAHRQLFVRTLSQSHTKGRITAGALSIPCALGRAGLKALKREGDGATPLGRFALRKVLFRADRMRRPHPALTVAAISPRDGWCDAPRDRNYNRPVRHPYPASAERLWRDDPLYDAIVVLSYNERPRVAGRGSAVFLHVARDGLAPTEGCVAVRRADLGRLLSRIGPQTVLSIGR